MQDKEDHNDLRALISPKEEILWEGKQDWGAFLFETFIDKLTFFVITFSAMEAVILTNTPRQAVEVVKTTLSE